MKIVQCAFRRWVPSTAAKKTFRSAAAAATTATTRPATAEVLIPFSTMTSTRGVRQFSTSSPLSSSESKSALLEILAREEKEEEELGNLELPEELGTMKKKIEKSFKIVEDGASTDLFKIDSSSGNKVHVSFHCQDTIETVDDQIYDEQEETLGDGDDIEADAEEDEVSSPVRFTVTVTKAGKSLVFACFSEFGEVKIDGVSTTGSSTPEYVHEHQGTLPKIEYQGPDYTELAQDLQDALVDYLDDECGVDSDLATFIAMFTDYREEVNYVNFLKEAQSIVS